jgi:hypothetical protein
LYDRAHRLRQDLRLPDSAKPPTRVVISRMAFVETLQALSVPSWEPQRFGGEGGAR